MTATKHLRFAYVFGLTALASTPCLASFHLMQIEQVIGAVNGDESKQAIQLRMRAVGQNLLSGAARLVAYDDAGNNPVVLIAFAANVPNGQLGDRVLVATPGFEECANVTADFNPTGTIPAAYWPAGSLTFEDATGAIIYWRLSWGGAGYTGPTDGAIDNDADGEFAPPFAGPLPSGISKQALRFTGTASAMSTTNAADYALTTGVAQFTNNAGENSGPMCIPTLSEWGIVVMALFVLTGGSVALRRGA
ncbi:MAG: IPTL-CTERM sorting domain-containing protein [Planctomycetes bacterium]|nr:IPTL-CTERM sorting domain-containing protein [Planctomycetota bacterium]